MPKGLRPVHARKAMVVSVHQQASQVGADILRQGGNAVDAAVATGFALAVVHPAAGNIGGGGFMLLRKANGELHFLDFREKAPKAASRDMYLDAQGNVIPKCQPDWVQSHRRAGIGGGTGLRGAALGQTFTPRRHGACDPVGA